jgi:hypothetical protein
MTRHPLDAVSLVAGLVFTAVAAAYLIAAHSAVDIDARWVLPLALIGLGLGGVVGSINTASRQRREAAVETATDDAEQPPLPE